MTVDLVPAATDSASIAPHARATDKTTRPHEGGFRDTIESILIAFILAFIFRAFVVEAFVIPTGSMAPTLLGAHARFTCDDCGYQFESNFSAGEDQVIPAEVSKRQFRDADCPNCGHHVHASGASTPGTVPVHYGDRILVLKYAYLFNEPQRWDVVVFKSPDDPDQFDNDNDSAGPNGYNKSWFTTNFIKRLVGKPGESLMVLDGDVYVSETGGNDPATFKVQGKPRHVQEALWRIVCDTEFLPHLASRDETWKPWQLENGAGWQLNSDDRPQRTYKFDNQSGAGTLRFDNALNRGRALTDFLAYAQNESGHNNVSDVKLSVLYQRTSGDGPLRLQLTKLSDTFTAELSPNGAKLFRKRGLVAGPDDFGEVVAQAANAPGVDGGPVRIELSNVDYTLTLRVGNTDVLTTSYDPDVAALVRAYASNRELPKPEVRIMAANQVCVLSHLSLWRDVYYTTSGSQIRWGRPDAPIHLGADEFFVLGDNTVISKDARYWTEPVKLPAEDLDVQAGRVPSRFMLGKAFFVYWPAGYRPFGSSDLPGLIPNFGDMRLIH